MGNKSAKTSPQSTTTTTSPETSNNNSDAPQIHWLSKFQMFDYNTNVSKDLDAAEKKAKDSKKHIFLLFSPHKERFLAVWQMALLAEALSTEFVTVEADANAREELSQVQGAQALVLHYDSHDIIECIEDAGNGARVCSALIKAWPSSEIPAYIKFARKEFLAPVLAKATFSMGCYWQGEHVLGAVQGVTGMLPGWLGGSEVVEVTYDPEETDYEAFASAAKSKSWRAFPHDQDQTSRASKVGISVGSKRDPKDPISMVHGGENKHHLKSTDPVYCRLPLTPLQQARANGLVGSLHLHKELDKLLSPHQKTLVTRINNGLKVVSGKVRYFPDTIQELPGYEERLMAALKDAGV